LIVASKRYKALLSALRYALCPSELSGNLKFDLTRVP
jgi:hypothetical protein